MKTLHPELKAVVEFCYKRNAQLQEEDFAERIVNEINSNKEVIKNGRTNRTQ